MNKEDKLKRFKITRYILLFWTLFIGIGAVAGATGMFVDVTGKTLGMDAMLPFFQVLPFAEILFQDFLFPGIALLIVNGITNLAAGVLIIFRKKSGYVSGTIFGFTLMCWIIIQFVIFPPNFMSIIYFIFGVLQLIAGIETLIYEKQCLFEFNIEDYKNISSNSETLVIYYSRSGYSRKIAYQKANELNANIYEVTTNERTRKILGFLWCGRFAMHKWKMPINEVNVDFSKYKKIIIVSPTWVFHIAAPIRTLLVDYKDTIKEKDLELNLLHFNPLVFPCTYKELKTLMEDMKIYTYSSRNGMIKLDKKRK